MLTHRAMASPTPQSIAAYVRKNAGQVKRAQKHRHGEMDSVREADYAGHHIVVRSRYRVEVDGHMLMGHMGGTSDGQVHYHPVPNLAFGSAVDLVKRLIDIFPDDFAKKGRSGMRGMRMGKRTNRQR